METLSEVRASLELGILVSTVLQTPGDRWWGRRGGWGSGLLPGGHARRGPGRREKGQQCHQIYTIY